MTEEIAVFYFLYTLILILVLLNTLIAIISDSYDKTVMKKDLIDCMEKLPMILESMAMISSWSRCKKRCCRRNDSYY